MYFCTRIRRSRVGAKQKDRDLAQLVAHTSGGREVAGSSPVIPTKRKSKPLIISSLDFFYVLNWCKSCGAPCYLGLSSCVPSASVPFRLTIVSCGSALAKRVCHTAFALHHNCQAESDSLNTHQHECLARVWCQALFTDVFMPVLDIDTLESTMCNPLLRSGSCQGNLRGTPRLVHWHSATGLWRLMPGVVLFS